MLKKEAIILIHDHNNDSFKNIVNSNKELIKTIIKKLILEDHMQNPEAINIIFLNDEDLLKINKRYLNHNDYTDIITFNYSEEKDVIDGELYISIERLLENAELNKVKTETEVLRLIIHGCLHLCGHDDKTKKGKKNMHDLENKYIELFHVEQYKKLKT